MRSIARQMMRWAPRSAAVYRTGVRGMAASINASDLTVTRNTSPKAHTAKEELKFGQTFTDHMLEIDWSSEDGWGKPKISPYGPLEISPAASSLHYALQCFEGMKAYVDADDNVRMFRPDMNMKRMQTSAARLCMQSFDEDAWLACIKELVKLDKAWIPKGQGYSLYLRPTYISTHPYIGVAAPMSTKLFCILSPVGPYYPTGFNPIKLLADPKNVRAWPGGTGNTKIGGNYAMSMGPGMEAIKQGYAQCLWLFGDDLDVTEVGTMNQFFVWINKEGKKEIVTAPLDGTILPGVTRDSILQLCREWGDYEVVERIYTLKEVMAACDEGRMIEAFGAGTAAIVSPVEGIGYLGKEYAIPLDKSDPSAKAGPLTTKIAATLQDIQYGKIEHPWSVVIDKL